MLTLSLIIVPVLMQLFGFALLSLSLSRHYSQVFSKAKRPTKHVLWILRGCGYAVILLAIGYAINSWGITLGLVYSFAIATLTATLIALLLTYKPQH